MLTLEVANPKVAILSAVESVNPAIPSTLDAAALCKMVDRGQITGAIVDGPLAFDNAISSDAARIKKIKSPVAGDPDLLMVPNLEAGNILFKELQYLAGALAAGVVVGAKVPSRSHRPRRRRTGSHGKLRPRRAAGEAGARPGVSPRFHIRRPRELHQRAYNRREPALKWRFRFRSRNGRTRSHRHRRRRTHSDRSVSGRSERTYSTRTRILRYSRRNRARQHSA